MKRLARMILFYTAIIAIWVIVAKMRLWPPYMFPPPWGVWESLKTGFQDHSFWIAISTTMKRMLIGYSLSVVLRNDSWSGSVQQQVPAGDLGRPRGEPQSLPHLLGTTRGAVVRIDRKGHFVCGAHGLVALGNDRYGRWSKQMPKIYGMAGRNLGASGFKLFWHVLLPASLPFIVSGLKQGWAFAWRSLIQAEMIFLSWALGSC